MVSESVNCYSTLPKIQKLALNNFQQSTIGEKDDLLSLPHLKSLSLRNCSNLSDASFENLSNSKVLSHLMIDDCENLTDISLSRVNAASLKYLHLQMMGCEISDWALRKLLAGAPCLTDLCLIDCLSLTDKTFEKLSLPSLRKFRLENMAYITDMAYIHLINSSEILDKFSLCRTAIAYSTLVELIMQMPALQSIVLEDSSLTWKEYQSLKNWVEVKSAADSSALPCNIEFLK